MAGLPPSAQQTHRRFLNSQFNAAFLDFAPKYMSNQLEQLAHECDERLERQLLPRLHAILSEIDQERDVFEEHKRDAARQLREHLRLLPLDAAAVEDAVSQVHAIVPRYIALLPTATSLALPAFGSAAVSASGTSVSSDGAFGTPDEDTDCQAPISPRPKPQSLSRAVETSAAQTEPWTPLTKPSGLDGEAETRGSAEGSTVPCGLKRPKVDHQSERDVSSKRQRTVNERSPGTGQPQIKRRVAFPNLMTGECIFRHAERKGFFVVRCNYCKTGFFTEPPLRYNRALKHFQKHKVLSDEGELTNEYIFERFALQVDGDEMASKYWIREHLGEMPHTFVPIGSSRDIAQVEDSEDTVRMHPEIEDVFSHPIPKLRGPLRNQQPDREAEHEKPRRARRNIPRPDYAEMVANKDPWDAADAEIEKTLKSANTARPATCSKRRLTKPGVKSTSKSMDTKK